MENGTLNNDRIDCDFLRESVSWVCPGVTDGGCLASVDGKTKEGVVQVSCWTEHRLLHAAARGRVGSI